MWTVDSEEEDHSVGRVLVTNDAAPGYDRIWPTFDISSE